MEYKLIKTEKGPLRLTVLLYVRKKISRGLVYLELWTRTLLAIKLSYTEITTPSLIQNLLNINSTYHL